MIQLQDVLQLPAASIEAVRFGDAAERSFKLGQLMDRVQRRSSNTSLLTTLSASHSGTVVNWRVYPGKHMKDSQVHWLKPYAKPILDNHPKKFAKSGDPQPQVHGRIRSADYIHILNGQAWLDDWKHPGFRDQGSGFSRVQASITSPDGIEEIMDGRFLTVSAGMTTDRLLCSACGSDWSKRGGRCDHMPGQGYSLEDGRGDSVMFFITGALYYDHLAKVNTPAQPYSTVLDWAFQDSQGDLFDTGELINSRLLQLTLIDSRDGPIELLMKADAPDPTLSWNDRDWVEASILDALASRGRLEDSHVDEVLPRIEAFRASDRKPRFGLPRFLVGPDGCLPLSDSDANVALEIVRGGYVKGADAKSLESRILECVDSSVSIQMGDSTMKTDLSKNWDEIVKMADGLEAATDQECDWKDFDGDLFDLATREGEAEMAGVQAGIIAMDKRLTSESRKALPDSAFCGPNRSFPAHDAAHVRNALARLPQAKNFTPAQKSRILACVKGRAKKLGVEISADQLEYDNLVAMLDKKDPEADVKPPADESVDQKAQRLEGQLTAAKAKIQDQDAKIGALMDEQTNLQAELKRLHATQVLNLRTQLGKPDVKALDSEEKRQEYLAKLNLRTLASLRDSISDLEAEVNVQEEGGSDPREGDHQEDPTQTMDDADQGTQPKGDGKPKEGENDDSAPEDRFSKMLSSAK